MTRSSIVVFISAAMAIVIASSPARAQFPDPTGGSSNIDGFAVLGKGSAAARPNRLEIDLEVSAASELTADAIVKYRDAKKRLQEAFSALKLSHVAVEERGLNVDQKGQTYNPYMMMEMSSARRAKVEVQLKRKLVVVCSNIREMDEEALLQLVAKLLDVAQDAGAKIGNPTEFNPYYYNPYSRMGSGLIRFILDDYEALEEKAYGEAITDARAKASRLAKLSGVELGRVAGIREVVVPGEQTTMMMIRIMNMGIATDDETPRKRLESSKFQEIPVRVELQVRFHLAGGSKPERREPGP